eukprot:CAMPEP_0198303286 /NCGR_PEP_ID=MMETSP1449-20131203/56808_1 /TAXON_ID=420275 /ORGANISM="Attheya septentrionalis, Strain CCMP2084" /LENGTH=675 /DNA_ID=CAMNT_0044005773 /DNA_START=342 /DNA_END=2369 /DNA_ORIENTATION=+
MPLSPRHRSRLRQDFQSDDEERLNVKIPTNNYSKGIATQPPLYSSRRPLSPIHRDDNSNTQNPASGIVKETFIEETTQYQHTPVTSPDFDQRSFVKKRDVQEYQQQLNDTSEFINRINASHGEDRMESSSRRQNMSDDPRDLDNASFDSFLLHDFAGLEAEFNPSTIHDEFASLEAQYNGSTVGDGFGVQEARQDTRRTIDDEFACLEAQSKNTSQAHDEFGGLEARYIGSTVDDEFAALEASCSKYDSYDDLNHRGNAQMENETYRGNGIVNHIDKMIHSSSRTEPKHKLECKPNSTQDEDKVVSRKAGLLAQPETATHDIKPQLLQRDVAIGKQQNNADNRTRGRSWELESNFSDEDPVASDFDLGIVHNENNETRRELPVSAADYKNESQIQYEKDVISLRSLNVPKKVNGKMCELPRTPSDGKRSQFTTSPTGRRFSDDDDDDRFTNDTAGPTFIRRHSFRNSLDSVQMQSIMDLSTGSDSEETEEKEEDKESVSSHSGPTNTNTSFLENHLSSQPLSSADRRAISKTYLNTEDRIAADNNLSTNNVYGEQTFDPTSFGTPQNHADIAKTYLNPEDRIAADNNLSSNNIYGDHRCERTSVRIPKNHVTDIKLSASSVSKSTELDELRTEAEMRDRQKRVRKLATKASEEIEEGDDYYSCIELVFHCKLCCG